MTTTPTTPPPPQYAATLRDGKLFRKIRKDKGSHKRNRFHRALGAAVRAWRKEWAR
jgi:hypothetical protein